MGLTWCAAKGWRREAVVVDSDWLIWLVRWLKGLWTVELSQITWWGFAAITSGGSIRRYGSLTGFSFLVDTGQNAHPHPLTDHTHTRHTHVHAHANSHAATHTREQTNSYLHFCIDTHVSAHRNVFFHSFFCCWHVRSHSLRTNTHTRTHTCTRSRTEALPRLVMCYCDDAECGGRWRIRQRKTGDAKMNIYNDCCCCRKIRILKKRPHIY